MKNQPPVLPGEDATDKGLPLNRQLKRGDNEFHHRRLAEEMAIIAEIGRLISSTLNLEEVYERFAAEVQKLISFDRFTVLLINRQKDAFTIAYIFGFDIPERRAGSIVPLKGSIVEILIRTPTGLIINTQNYEDLVRQFPSITVNYAVRAGIRSLLGIPLISRGEVIGAMHFRSKKANVYIEEDLRLATRIGEQISGAIANAQLYSGLRKTEEALRRSWQIAERLAGEMEIIAEIGRLISSTLNIEEVYERFAEETRKLISFDRLNVNLISPDGKSFINTYVSGFDIPERRAGNVVPIAGSITEILVNTRTGLILHPKSVEDMVRQFPSATATVTVRAGMRSIMGVPLISRGEVIGAMHFRSRKPDAYTEEDLRLAERIGEQISGAIANAQLYAGLKKTEEELRRSRQISERLAGEMEIIAGIGRLVSSTLNIEEVYERFAAEARKLIHFDRVSVNLLNPDGESFTNAYVSGFYIHERIPGTVVPIAGSVSELLIRERSGRIIHVESPEDLMRQFPSVTVSLVVQAGIRSMIGVPLISRGEAIGNLHFRSKKPNAYTEQDLRLAERIGEQIAGAIANARLYGSLKKTEKSLRESEELYSRLLAAVPDAVVRTDVYGRIRFVSDIAIRMSGYTGADEMLEKNIISFIDREERERAMENYRLMLEGRQGPQEYHLITKNDGRIPIEINGNLLRNDDGAPFGIVIVCRDITKRKKLEQELRDTLDKLECRVRDRTIELEETNTALRVLLKKGGADQRNLEERVQANVDQLVMPFLTKLRATQITEQGLAYLNILETNLNNIVSPFINQLSAAYRNLTPKEIKIAVLIKEGRSSKEIAKLLGVSVGTIVTHRNNIRKKLRLRSKNTNLRSHLLFLS